PGTRKQRLFDGEIVRHSPCRCYECAAFVANSNGCDGGDAAGKESHRAPDANKDAARHRPSLVDALFALRAVVQREPCRTAGLKLRCTCDWCIRDKVKIHQID